MIDRLGLNPPADIAISLRLWMDGPRLRNLVHVWVGRDMSPGSSPNDPVFFLNHCNVDRHGWQRTVGYMSR